MHLGTLFAELHQFDFDAVRVMGPALPVIIRPLLGSVVLGSPGLDDFFPGFLYIVDGQAEMEESDVLILIRIGFCGAVKPLDELPAAAIYMILRKNTTNL